MTKSSLHVTIHSQSLTILLSTMTYEAIIVSYLSKKKGDVIASLCAKGVYVAVLNGYVVEKG